MKTDSNDSLSNIDTHPTAEVMPRLLYHVTSVGSVGWVLLLVTIIALLH